MKSVYIRLAESSEKRSAKSSVPWRSPAGANEASAAGARAGLECRMASLYSEPKSFTSSAAMAPPCASEWWWPPSWDVNTRGLLDDGWLYIGSFGWKRAPVCADRVVNLMIFLSI